MAKTKDTTSPVKPPIQPTISPILDPNQPKAIKEKDVKIKAYNFTATYTWKEFDACKDKIASMASTLINRMARDVLTFYDITYKFDNKGKEQAFIAKKGQTIPLDIKMLVEFSESLKTIITNSLVGKDTTYGIVNYNGSYVLVSGVVANKKNEYFITIDGKDYLAWPAQW